MSRDDRSRNDAQGGKLLAFQHDRRNGSVRGGPSRYDAAFEEAAARFAAQQRLLERERVAADRLIERLVDLPFERRRLLIDNCPRFHTWGLAERLLEEGERHTGQLDGSAQLDLTRTAVAVAGKLDARTYGRYRHRDLQALSWAHLGNALRVSGRHDDAAQAFVTSRRHLGRGTGCATEEAQVLSFEASLLNTLSRFDAARDLADRALLRLPQGVGRLRAELLIKRAMAERGTARARAAYGEAYDLVSSREEPLIASAALQGITAEMERAGRIAEAHETLVRAVRLLPRSNRWGGLILRWSAGVLALRGGETTTAAGILGRVCRALGSRDVRDGHLPTGCLDLVIAHAAGGEEGEAVRLAESFGDLLAARGYPPAVLSGWAEVRNRLALGRLSVSTLHPFTDYFRRAWCDPRAELVLPA